MVEDKHTISVLTENILYDRLRAFDEDDNMEPKDKEEKKQEAIEVFVKECAKESTELSEEDIRKLVHSVLDRTRKNLKGEGR